MAPWHLEMRVNQIAGESQAAYHDLIFRGFTANALFYSTSGTPTQSSTTSASPTSSSFNPDPTLFQYFEFRAWSEPNFQGEASEVYKEEGFYDLPFNLSSWVWATDKTDCCVSFCLDEDTYGGGYRCDSKRQRETTGGVGYPRVSLWCGNRLDVEARHRCS